MGSFAIDYICNCSRRPPHRSPPQMTLWGSNCFLFSQSEQNHAGLNPGIRIINQNNERQRNSKQRTFGGAIATESTVRFLQVKTAVTRRFSFSLPYVAPSAEFFCFLLRRFRVRFSPVRADTSLSLTAVRRSIIFYGLQQNQRRTQHTRG